MSPFEGGINKHVQCLLLGDDPLSVDQMLIYIRFIAPFNHSTEAVPKGIIHRMSLK